MNENDSRQAIIDGEHLRLLSIGYIISGIFSALFSLMGLMYAVIGLVMSRFFSGLAKDSNHPVEVPPEFMGTFIALFGGAFFLVLVSLALAKFWAASRIRRRKSRVAIQVVAAITCFGVPYGTILGVCTFMVMSRKSVVDVFDAVATADDRQIAPG
ncbi:hypothetical protein [Dokdonella sp.]|uniref:hypothetical protein n=1 Tax=Dokdonella sp. TaxID=2291710 RepID=UPI003526C6CA